MELILIHWHRLWHCCKFMCSIFSKTTQPLDFIKATIIRKLQHIESNILVKLMEVWSCFFENLWIKFFWNYLRLDSEQYGKNQYKKKEHNQQFSVQSVMVTFALFKCHRSINNSINFYLFILSWKGSWQRSI